MTYKAGDKVVYEGKIHTIEIPVLGGCYINGVEQKVYNFNLTPATPVEIAKQAVLDEVSSIANNSTDDFNHALNVLIETAILEGMERMKSTVFASSTPPIIGDETKLS